MSKESERILRDIDKYLAVMSSQGKLVDHVHTTPAQYKSLEKAHKDDSGKIKRKFTPRYKGVELIPYDEVR